MAARCILFGAILFMGCAADKTPALGPRPVKHAEIGIGSAEEQQTFAGSVQARDATSLSFRVGGNLAQLHVKMGDRVKKGKLIGSLDQGDFKVALAQAQANYQNAVTQRDTARSSFRRVERLYEAGSASQSDYETTQGQLRSAQAQLSAAGQQVKQARNQLGYTELRAPFDGVVNSVPVKVGELLSAGQPTAVLSKGGELEAVVGVPEGVVSRIQVGSPVEVAVSAVSASGLIGTVREVGFVSENSTYPIRMKFAQPPPSLRPGMAAQVRFTLGTSKAGLKVPVSAVGNEANGTFVFLLEETKDDLFVVRKRTIVVDKLQGNWFELREGLKAGDKVAIAGLANLVDGMTVRLLAPRVVTTRPVQGNK